MLQFLVKLDFWIERCLRWFSIGCIVMLTVVLVGVVFVRFFPIAKLSWSDEAIEWAFAWMVFMGSAALWRRNEHFCVDALSCRLGRMRGGMIHSLCVGLLSLAFFVIFTYYGYLLTISANDRSPILEWPRPLWYASMPLAPHTICSGIGHWPAQSISAQSVAPSQSSSISLSHTSGAAKFTAGFVSSQSTP